MQRRCKIYSLILRRARCVHTRRINTLSLVPETQKDSTLGKRGKHRTMGMHPSETGGSRSLGRLPSILCQGATWQPGCAQASFSWPSAGRHSWPCCQPITQKDVAVPCQCLPQPVTDFLGPLSHRLLQLNMELQTIYRKCHDPWAHGTQ